MVSGGHDTAAGQPLRVEACADAAAAARRAAAWIAEVARQAIEDRGRFVVALSGGHGPREMLRLLATEAIDWRSVHVVQVDERVAPSGSSDRNLTQLEDALLARVPIPPGQVYPMLVDAPDLAAAADDYARLLVGLAGAPPVLDLVQLGLGVDGHTASLLPGDAALDVTGADVAITGRYRGWRRMTLTFPIINRARNILWLAAGAEKSTVVARLVRADPSIPASRVNRASALLLVDQCRDTG
jgi:6-phosphogluconolactonase